MAQKPSYNKSDKPHNPDMKLYAVFPDYWKDKWGDRPLLGYVRATDSFSAERKAYDIGLLRVNFTFKPEVKEVSENTVRRPKKTYH